jgi:hypothetical protein
MAIMVGDDKISAETAFTYTDDNGDDYVKAIGRYDGAIDTREDLEDFYNENIKVYRNWKGRIVLLEGDVNTTSDTLYGVVLKYGSGLEEEVKLYTKDDDDVVYKFEESDDFDWLKANAPVGSIVQYELNKDSEIAEYGNYSDIVFKTSDTDKIYDGDDFGSKSVEIDNKNYYVTSDTIFFDYTKHDEDDVEVFDWEDIKEKDVEEDVTVIFNNDGSDLDFVAIWDNLDDIRDDVMVGYVVDTSKAGEDLYAEVALFGQDETKEYELTSSLEKEIKDDKRIIDGRIILFETTSGGKLDLVTDKDWEIVAGMVEEVDSDKITIEGEDYVVDDDVLVYEGSTKEDFDKIDEKDFVAFAAEKGEVKAVELVYAKDSGDKYGEGEITSISPFKVEGFSQTFTDDINDALVGDGYIVHDNDINDYNVGDEIKFLYETDRDEIQAIWTKETGSTPVNEDVKAVEDKITALPAAADITLDNETDVNEAKAAYDALTSDEKTQVDSDLKTKLDDCVDKIDELNQSGQNDSKITDAEFSGSNMFGNVTGKYASDVTKVEICYGDFVKEAKMENGEFSWQIFGSFSEITVKGYVGSDLVDTDVITVQ